MPVITPGGGLGAHIDVKEFLPYVPQSEYSAGALSCALYICGGIRGMERGTLSEEREPDGTERIASMELLRLAFPRRVFTLSQTEVRHRPVKWLFDHRQLVGGWNSSTSQGHAAVLHRRAEAHRGLAGEAGRRRTAPISGTSSKNGGNGAISLLTSPRRRATIVPPIQGALAQAG